MASLPNPRTIRLTDAQWAHLERAADMASSPGEGIVVTPTEYLRGLIDRDAADFDRCFQIETTP